MAHARKKILCVEDHREIAALGLSASNGISCFTEQQSQDGVRNPAHNLILLVLRLMISSRLANGRSEALECFVGSVLLGELQQLVSAHGYWAVALIVGLESMGLPLPGETILVLAAIYAATEPNFNVGVVIAAAAFGAIVGDNAGYWLGLRYGYAILLRYGERIGMFEARIKLGQYLFLKHGAKVVFLGRFVALLRMLAAFLAGVNRMPWRAFLIANTGGGIIWATVFGIGGYFFGKLLLQLHHALAPIVFALVLAAFFGCGYLVRRYEDRLTISAERALPGPLVAAVDNKRP